MKRKIPWLTAALSLALLGGCGSPVAPEPAPPPPKPQAEAKLKVFCLDEPLELSLADLLGKPRQELAGLAAELLELARAEQKSFRQGRQAHGLLPDLRLPLAVPVFREAAFVPETGLSLPPYLKAGQKDNEIALHLARYGDWEGALRVADPASALVEEIKALKGGKNYPVEWTRVVALHQHLARARLVTGDSEGARQLIGLHKQLQDVLDAKARRGPLGAALLAGRRGVLGAAAAAWRQGGRQDLAQQADDALAHWGEVPLPAAAAPGSPRGEVARLLGSAGKGHALRAPDTARAFDLLALPLPEEAVDGVVACFTASDRLAQCWVVYRHPIRENYPSPAQLGELIADHGPSGKDVTDAVGLRLRSYELGNVVYEVAVLPDSPAAGAVVCLRPSQTQADGPALPRDFGAVHLDRSFEQNRVRFALRRQGSRITVTGPENLTRVKNPVPAMQAVEATLERDPRQDVVRRFTWSFALGERGLPGLAELALPLWEDFGPARLDSSETEAGKYLTLVWEDARTRLAFRVPRQKGRTPELEIHDSTPAEGLTGRAAQVAANDRAERRARFARDKLLLRLPRTWESIRLGMSRAEVQDALPRGEGVIPRKIPGGLGVVLKGTADEGAVRVARELFIRFGPDDRAAEVRVRYTNAPGKRGKAGVKTLIGQISRRGGAPAEAPGPWASVWTPPFVARKPAPVLYRWQDDATLLTCQRDSEGVELVLRDCPPEHPAGVRLPPFRCLPLGPSPYALAMTKTELLKGWKGAAPQIHRGVLVLQPKGGPYDQIFVRFDEDGRAVQITARHNLGETSATPAQMAAAVRHAWGTAVEELGWPRREDRDRGKELQSWASHDDLARVSIFWQARKSAAPQRFTEWKRLGP
jgi:hypothetical protein